MNRDALLSRWTQLREQWAESVLVRLGAWLGLALVCLYLLLAGFDAADAALERSRALAAEANRLQTLSKEGDWPQRSQEVAGLRAAYDTTVWADPDLALTEASLQDWLRNTAQRLGLKVREITLVRAEPSAKPLNELPPGYVVLRARVSIEVQRTPLFTLLAEMASQERRIVVERFVMRGTVQPAIAEMDLRVLARPASKP
ncbi:MAG: hypothetical protein EOP39_28740 [Rubrivivax sp.]|nr:MAG: hypothetical protein EOP39_28740 [Rubrivivax sp.]